MEIKNLKECEDGSVVFEVTESWEAAPNRTAEEIVLEAVGQVCREQEYSLLKEPEFTIGQADQDHFSASVRMVVYPNVQDLNYIGIAVIKPVKKVTEAEIDAAVKRYMEVHPWEHGTARGNAACTDEYVKAHVKGARTVQEFRELQRIRLQRTYDARNEQAFDRNLERALAELVTCPVPDCMVEVGVQEYVDELTKLGMQKGQTLDRTLRARGQTLEQFKGQVRPAALIRVKASIALDYIMNKENLDQEKAYSFVREHCKVVEAEVKRT